MNPIIEEILQHSGVLRRSGRYPWGSGQNPHQHSGDFISRYEEMKDSGKSDNDIAEAMGLTTTQFRVQRSLARDERRAVEAARAKTLRDNGLSLAQITKEMGYNNDSSIRSLLDEGAEARMNQAKKTADFLKSRVDELGMVEVGAGVNISLGVSPEKMKEALYICELDGYPTYGGRVPQVTNPGKMTTLTVLCPPGTEHKEIYQFDKINSIVDKYVSHDGGDTFNAFVYPKSMDSSRLKIRYAEEGGVHKDGVIELRRGVEDLSLGNSHYAQVRILVDGNRYLKGMAIYSDDLPDGVDVMFNTNKKVGTPKMDVLKKISADPDNPFGSLIKAGGQKYYDDPNGDYTDPVTGKKQSLSLINKRAEEGDWGDWSDHLPSQFLSKQPKQLIEKQLNLASANKVAEYEEIKALTNPTIKKVMLKTFAEDCDSAAVHLQAAALPRQKYKVILPVTTLPDTEVYAPTYQNGEKLALIRFPHGGTFEIPILTVNNKHKDAARILGNAVDAIGINSKVAERLSGADFDGDAVMTIPTGNKINILSTKPLKGLEGFDTKSSYQYDKVTKDSDGTEHYYRGDREFRPMRNTQTEMGRISNLITDMTLKGATEPELAKAVRHSMVVIDAEKHHLDYKQSELDNNIALLKKKYQGKIDENGRYKEGASTLISRSKSETSVLKRKGSPTIDPDTGELKYKLASTPYDVVKYKDPTTGKLTKPTAVQLSQYKKAVLNGDNTDDFIVDTRNDGSYDVVKYRNPTTKKLEKPTNEQMAAYRKAVENGESTNDFVVKTKERTQPSTKMAEAKDALALSSGTQQEKLYGEYANQMKALANSARKEMISTEDIKYNSSAKETYQQEVNTLLANLNISKKNSARERYAQTIANSVINAKKQDNPDMTSGEIKKASQQELVKARLAVGAKREPIPISDREWEAIQAGAISPNKLSEIINHVDSDTLRQRATPRATTSITPVQKNKIKAMIASGYTTSEIAKAIGVSATTVSNYTLGKGVNN